jgi:hypothetical protein
MIEYSKAEMRNLEEQWRAAWPQALAVWSKFTRLRMPTLCFTKKQARKEGLETSFAMIRLDDQAIIVSLPDVADCGVQAFAVEILAHEIGHHVLAPANLTDHVRMIARMRQALPTVEHFAPMVANLYTDLLINDRLQRSAQLRIADVYRALGAGKTPGAVWTLYLRIYEILWVLERGALGGPRTSDELEGDAWLGKRLIRSYARDWLEGSGRFAALLLPHLLEDQGSRKIIEKWLDTEGAGRGGNPSGVIETEPGEHAGAIHPAQDPALADLPEEGAGEDAAKPPDATGNFRPQATAPTANARGQAREPFEYGEILRATGLNLSDHDLAVRYYRDRALPNLIPFPSRQAPESTEPLMEGLEPWEFGHPLDAADWLQSVMQSPRPIPGLTTVQRVWGTVEGQLPERIPLDLDLYVDSSGSMPNPQVHTSYPALAGAILCLSALRAGANVQTTLWSGKQQVTGTDGFVRDEEKVLRVLTGYFGGATAFPIHVLRETYQNRRPGARPAHIVVISDDGISTMFDPDEKGNRGWDVAAAALKKAAGGGTFVLNLMANWEQHPGRGPLATIREARDEQGWRLFRVGSWEELVEFARDFSREHYGDGGAASRPQLAAPLGAARTRTPTPSP